MIDGGMGLVEYIRTAQYSLGFSMLKNKLHPDDRIHKVIDDGSDASQNRSFAILVFQREDDLSACYISKPEGPGFASRGCIRTHTDPLIELPGRTLQNNEVSHKVAVPHNPPFPSDADDNLETNVEKS